MAKTKEELSTLKEEVENISSKLHELTEEELEQVTGGAGRAYFFRVKVKDTPMINTSSVTEALQHRVSELQVTTFDQHNVVVETRTR